VISETKWAYLGSDTMISDFTNYPINNIASSTQDNPSLGSYWKWEKPSQTYVYKRSIVKKTTKTSTQTTFTWNETEWSAPILHSFRGNTNSSYLNSVNIFDALTAGGEKQGIYYANDKGEAVSAAEFDPSNHKMYLNATYIKAGEITSDFINTKDL